MKTRTGRRVSRQRGGQQTGGREQKRQLRERDDDEETETVGPEDVTSKNDKAQEAT